VANEPGQVLLSHGGEQGDGSARDGGDHEAEEHRLDGVVGRQHHGHEADGERLILWNLIDGNSRRP
jgi:hypothetical protein